MKPFAKLYEHDTTGQILVTLDTSYDGQEPVITIWFQPEGLGVCKLKSTFENEDNYKAWDQAEEAFSKVTEEQTVSLVNTALSSLGLD